MIAILRRSQGKLISSLFLSVGIFLLIQVIAPLVSFEVWAIGQKINSRTLVSPVKSSEQILGISVQDRNNFPAFISYLKRETQPNYDQFSLSIPKLKIERQDVLVDTNYLSESLAHLSGSALPGEKGNVFISGHSALSKLSAIKSVPFSKLPELKKGDQIIVETLGSKFVYEVSDFKVVDPTDLSVVEAPETQGRYISLMTCVPPGLNLKRLVVLGKMI
ncbi:MAG: class E sortase [Candidatus Daviesbacteria bacterium]|nr:class E sortase [Candidatus Daviesbacteria bacterium]